MKNIYLLLMNSTSFNAVEAMKIPWPLGLQGRSIFLQNAQNIQNFL